MSEAKPYDALPECDVLLLSWGHEIRVPFEPYSGPQTVPGQGFGQEQWRDEMWAALLSTFGIAEAGGPGQDQGNQQGEPPTGTPYARNLYRVLGDLQAYDAFQVRNGRSRRLRPKLGRAPVFGHYFNADVPASGGGAPVRVLLFNSSLRLNTGGTTLPVRQMVRQLLDDRTPGLVLSVGFGGGTSVEDRAGNVVVTSRARYRLPGDLRGFPDNGTVFGSSWQPQEEWFANLEFERLAEQPLIAPSEFYEPAPAPPAAVAPLLATDRRPVLTAPLLTDHGFELGPPGINSGGYLGRDACATDMDAAPVAQVCGEAGVPCGFVVGLLLPLLAHLRYDSKSFLRKGWIDHLTSTYAKYAAQNAARTAYAICGFATQPAAADPGTRGVDRTGQWLW